MPGKGGAELAAEIRRGARIPQRDLGANAMHGPSRPQSCPWPFASRTTGPPWKPPIADVVEKSKFVDSNRSRVPIGEPGKTTGQWLHPKVAHWNCRPVADYRLDEDRPLVKAEPGTPSSCQPSR